jgi:hypothetical protein
MKEVLRYHPIGYHLVKQSLQEDVIPLQHPICTSSGQQLSKIRIPKGLRITMSIAAYNRSRPFQFFNYLESFFWRLNVHYRNKEIFGEDADTFNPNRWLAKSIEGKNDVALGVIGNL